MPGLKEKCIRCGKEFDLSKDDYIKGRKLCDECTEIVLKKVPPVWLVRLIAVVVTLILRMAAFPDSLWLVNISSLLLGIACLVLFYVRKHYHQQKSGAGYGIITLILTIFGVLYTVIGLGGILTQLGVF